MVYAYSPDGSNSEPIEIEIENKPYTEALKVDIELNSNEDQSQKLDKKYLNVKNKINYQKFIFI